MECCWNLSYWKYWDAYKTYLEKYSGSIRLEFTSGILEGEK